ncbi:hypothetical protein DOM21_09890 [Bacteriovorax stolpii]|uniref:Uncharacterized protein n=1 Tax=Bacteriovorax stolpii TaxID=960 RepID=A0A2K9NRW9_BACTC|nr:hypothetical protein [Bacteriovorax stolpii]AUN98263.1 hypothetical protein C0V70_09130 [Bacteriovorax stolpii]QDK41757.1 hypothetical protein DOM21_09890 [Bacteriovorax stolpii]TDP52186.1 hypothetical protein C8D79_2836 [Bacteriovorax stolpii]
MKKLLFTLILAPCCLMPLKAHSFDASVRGFIALDALNFEKIAGSKGASVIGIGVLDLKIFAEQDDMSAAIKLDLDGKLDRENNIFEEAYATYKGIPNVRLMLGKGVVRFQNLHWGAVENTYQDGGTVIQADNNYRKLSRKAFIAASYGGRSKGFINQFTLFGDSTENYTDQNGDKQYVTSTRRVGSTTYSTITGYKTEEVTAFNTSREFGLANKLELFTTDSLKLTFGQFYYKNRMHNKANYALDIGLNYESSTMEIWVDSLYGFSSKLPYEPYTTKAKNEYFLQVGMEYFLNEKWSLVENVEGLLIKDLQHTYAQFTENGTTYYPTTQQERKSNVTNKIKTYKIESAIKYKITKSAQITFGGLYEKKIVESNGVKGLKFVQDVRNANRDAYKLATSISFWF